ncbi:MAG: hypothetical protein ACM3U1_07990 [Chloroflexota bacterium]
MYKFAYSALALLALFFLAGCDDGSVNGDPVDNPNDNTPTYHPLIPLGIGNNWVYKRTLYDDKGAQQGDPVTYSMQILRDTTVNNIAGVIARAWKDDTFIANKSDGFYAYDDGLIDDIELFYKYPVVKGDSYLRASGETVIVEDLKRSVTVPAGTFECVVFKVLYQDNKFYEVNYFVKGVGMVKTEDWGMNWQNVYMKSSSEELISKNF